jgi:hypothetical protein
MERMDDDFEDEMMPDNDDDSEIQEEAPSDEELLKSMKKYEIINTAATRLVAAGLQKLDGVIKN